MSNILFYVKNTASLLFHILGPFFIINDEGDALAINDEGDRLLY
jgi:hypothetical protein